MRGGFVQGKRRAPRVEQRRVHLTVISHVVEMGPARNRGQLGGEDIRL